MEIGLRIYLVGLELWKERDYIAIGTEKLALTLSEFYYYATYELRHRVQFDHSGIIVYVSLISPFQTVVFLFLLLESASSLLSVAFICSYP